MHAILDLVFAPACLGCAAGIPLSDPARPLCRRCRAQLEPLPTPGCPRCGAALLQTGRDAGPRCPECEMWPASLRAARSAFLLQPPADRLVHQLKYNGWHILAEAMGQLMARVTLPLDAVEEATRVVPVPTTRKRLRERGYNQAALLADAFARARGLELAPVLERRGTAGSQTGLQPAARGANVAGAFAVQPDARGMIPGEHLILIDDVLTTGATARECVHALTAAGARCVTVVTFARAAPARPRADTLSGAFDADSGSDQRIR